MPIKARKESRELKILRILNARMDLSREDQYYLHNLEKGYEGEVQFDSLTSHLESKFFILQDLLLEVNHSEFQIDSLIITQDSLIPCDVKYFEGNYTYRDGNFYKKSADNPTTNPLHQLNRCKTLLNQFLHHHGFKFSIEGHLVYINPEFFLYNAPHGEPLVFRPQIPSFLNSLSMKPSNLTNSHQKLVDVFLREHIMESRHVKLPAYNYEMQRKGLICAKCCTSSFSFGKKKIVCKKCGATEEIETAVVRSVEEIKLLFPEMKITTNLVFDWINKKQCKRKIIKILKNNYQSKGFGKWFYFE